MVDPGSDTVAPMDVEALKTEATTAIEALPALAALDELRSAYLGRKSDLKQALREVRDRDSGMALNAAREAIEAAVDERERTLRDADLQRALSEESVDITLPGTPVARGHLHLI